MGRHQRQFLSLLAAVGVVLSVGLLAPRLVQGQLESAGAPGAISRSADDPYILPPAEPTADHTQFEILKQEFKSGPEVTAACLTCHTEASKQIMQTSHWTWICPRAREELAEKQGRVVGKGEHVINNFCIALASNEPRCTSCHAGYGWKDQSFDFENETLVDCLVCHAQPLPDEVIAGTDKPRTYKKYPTDAGHPVYQPKEWPKGSGNVWQPPDLSLFAQYIGKPTRDNCGTCHFFGGGGEGVKHGDMDVTLSKPTGAIDVHMNAFDGPVEGGFRCTQCHTTRNHRISGRCFTIPAVDERDYVVRGIEHPLIACESCHTTTPHKSDFAAKLNDHTDKVSCQTCHVPYIAPEKATKMWWDWELAGRVSESGKPVVEKQPILPEGVDAATLTEAELAAYAKEDVYNGQKGSFIWARRATPEYYWFNGDVSHTFIGDVIDDKTPARDIPNVRTGKYDHINLDDPIVRINVLHGDYDDPRSRIWPAKIHRGRQLYDPQTKMLIVPKLFPNGPDASEAYWKAYDWPRAIAAGMTYINHEWSGEYAWIQTEMAWPLKHMVVPKENALTCVECHSPEGRLAALTGFYMPGRDRSPLVDWLGFAMIAGALALALAHGAGRVVLGARNNNGGAKH